MRHPLDLPAKTVISRQFLLASQGVNLAGQRPRVLPASPSLQMSWVTFFSLPTAFFSLWDEVGIGCRRSENRGPRLESSLTLVLPMTEELYPVNHFFRAEGRPEFEQATHPFANAQTLLLNCDDTEMAAVLAEKLGV